jgi:Glycosyltransferase family 87
MTISSRLRRVTAWYALFAVYAGGVAVFSGPGDDRSWGIWAAFGYAAAAVLAAAWPSRRGRLAALAASLAGGLIAPLTWVATQARATPDVVVVTRSAALLLHHATTYLPSAQLAHGGWLAYNPYLPAMAIFGLPRALGLAGLAGDPRPWLAVATFLLLAAAFRGTAFRGTAFRGTAFRGTAFRGTAFRGTAFRGTASGATARGRAGWPGQLGRAAFATASPVLAFPLTQGITDPPVLALTCLALALLARPASSRAWPAALLLGVVCALKYTAWPALVVLTAMIAARDGRRAAARFAATAVTAAAILVAALAPAAVAAPAALIQNTLAYPLGLTRARTPAQSPLPGHLLAGLGPAGRLAAIILLITAGLAIATSLITRPPVDAPAATRRLALGLTLMFALSPATRFGYFAYPVGLYGWVALCGQGSPRLGRLLDRGERHRDPAVRVLRAPGDLRLRLRSVALLEPGDASREELPRLGQPCPPVDRSERVSPAHIAAADHEGELPARLGHHNLAAGLPGSAGLLVPAGEPGTHLRASTVIPPAGLADRAPLAHPGHVRDQCVQGLGRARDHDRL